MIQRWRTDMVYTPGFLPHRNHSSPGLCGRCEVQVAHFRQRIAYRIVDGAFTDVAAFDVCDRHTQRQCRGRRCEYFITICDQQQNIGAQPIQNVGETEHRDTDRFGHAQICV